MLTIGKAATLSGLSVDTIRFYEREGLLPQPRRTESRYRLYDESVISRLRFIRRAKQLGFTLKEIQELLFLNDGGGNRKSVRAVAEKRVLDVAQKIEELLCIRKTLEHLVKQCDGHGPLIGCPIIEAMSNDVERNTKVSTTPVRGSNSRRKTPR